jgi:hypothetical protein
MWPAPRRPRRALLPQFLELLAILAFLLICYQAMAWVWALTAPREIRIPAIVGLQRKEAMALLQNAGLRPEVIAEKASEKVAEGAVLAAEPGPGRVVKAGRTVRLTLSSGSRWSRVPDVSDMSVDRALALLREAKLIVRKQRARYHEKVPVGYVLAQRPPAGERVPRGTEVELWVSKGPEPETEVEEQAPVDEGPRSTQIEVTVPPGASLQEVKIVVTDRRGTHTIYEQYLEPGEVVSQTVTGEGRKCTARAYVSGILAREVDF